MHLLLKKVFLSWEGCDIILCQYDEAKLKLGAGQYMAIMHNIPTFLTVFPPKKPSTSQVHLENEGNACLLH